MGCPQILMDRQGQNLSGLRFCYGEVSLLIPQIRSCRLKMQGDGVVNLGFDAIFCQTTLKFVSCVS